MKVLEASLFKLALCGALTLDEAKILKALYANRAGSVISLCVETGLERLDAELALDSLKSRGIVSQADVFYFVVDFGLKLSELVSGAEKENALAYARLG